MSYLRNGGKADALLRYPSRAGPSLLRCEKDMIPSPQVETLRPLLFINAQCTLVTCLKSSEKEGHLGLKSSWLLPKVLQFHEENCQNIVSF